MLLPHSAELLRQWASRETWHTGHATDEAFFYRFIHAYVKEHGYELDESALQERISAIADCYLSDELQTEVREKVNFMKNLLDYLKIAQSLDS